MNINNLSYGNKQTNEYNAVIEISAGSFPVKYEMDKESGALLVDRFISTSMFYPCNYGFIPNTLADDGDPIDVLVITPTPLVPASVIKIRAIGVLIMEDESGKDEKIITVPVAKLTPYYNHIKTYKDLPEILLEQIKHFFQNYKDLESGKWVKIDNFESSEKANELIIKAIKN